MTKRKEYGPSEGQRMMRGLAQAAKQVRDEERKSVSAQMLSVPGFSVCKTPQT